MQYYIIITRDRYSQCPKYLAWVILECIAVYCKDRLRQPALTIPGELTLTPLACAALQPMPPRSTYPSAWPCAPDVLNPQSGRRACTLLLLRYIEL